MNVHVLWTVVALLCFARLAAAKTWYISGSGSDSNSGDHGSIPWQTFGHALNRIQADGDPTPVVLVGTGFTYREQVDALPGMTVDGWQCSGCSSNPFVISGADVVTGWSTSSVSSQAQEASVAAGEPKQVWVTNKFYHPARYPDADFTLEISTATTTQLTLTSAPTQDVSSSTAVVWTDSGRRVERVSVASVSGTTVTLSSALQSQPTDGARVFFEGKPSFLSVGEWIWSSGKLHVHASGGLSGKTVEASVRDYGVRLNGLGRASNTLTYRQFIVEKTSKSCIRISDTQDVYFTDMITQYCGWHGVHVDGTSAAVKFSDLLASDTMAGGFVYEGPNTAFDTEGSTVNGGEFRDVGIYPGRGGDGLYDQSAIRIASGQSFAVRHNKIHRSGNHGIVVNAADVDVQFNHIEDACFVHSRCAAVMLTNRDSAGSVVQNLVETSDTFSHAVDADYVSHGVVLPPSGASAVFVNNNVIIDQPGSGILVRGGVSATVSANSLFGCQIGISNEPASPTGAANTYTGNVIYASRQDSLTFSLGEASFASDSIWGNFHGTPFRDIAVRINSVPPRYLSFSSWSATFRSDGKCGLGCRPSTRRYYQYSTTTGANQVQNPTFDSGINLWSSSSLVCGTSTHASRSSMHCESASTGSVSTVVTVQIGIQYQLHVTAWSQDTQFGHIEIVVGSTTIPISVAAEPSEQTVMFTPVTNSATLQFQLVSSSPVTSFNLDDVYLEPVTQTTPRSNLFEFLVPAFATSDTFPVPSNWAQWPEPVTVSSSIAIAPYGAALLENDGAKDGQVSGRVDCQGAWGTWSSCNGLCTQTSVYNVNLPAQGGGDSCPQNDGDTRTQECPVTTNVPQCQGAENCRWKFSDWIACNALDISNPSLGCKMTRRVEVLSVEGPGGACPVVDGALDEAPCTQQLQVTYGGTCNENLPLDCKGAFDDWSECQLGCTKQRKYTWTNAAFNGGQVCPYFNNFVEVASCTDGQCVPAQNCEGRWTDSTGCVTEPAASDCSRYKQFIVTQEQRGEGAPCGTQSNGVFQEWTDGLKDYSPCSANSGLCAPGATGQHCIGHWTDYPTRCPASCKKTRQYVHVQSQSGDGDSCAIPNGYQQDKPCGGDDCQVPVNCQGEWSAPSQCSAECVQERAYAILQPPNVSGLPCPYQEGEKITQPCNNGQCLSCEGAWSSWTPCDVTCKQSRSYTITRPASSEQAGVCPVQDGAYEERVCASGACIDNQGVDCMGSWNAWDTCGANCWQKRSFQVNTHQSGSGAQCVDDSGVAIFQNSQEQRQCTGGDCKPPVHCQGSWGSWSNCDDMCETTRTFEVLVPDANGGTQCRHADAETETKSCTGGTCVYCEGSWDYQALADAPCQADCTRSRTYTITQQPSAGGAPCPIQPTTQIGACAGGFCEAPGTNCEGAFTDWSQCVSGAGDSCTTQRTYIIKQPKVDSGADCEFTNDHKEIMSCADVNECYPPVDCNGAWQSFQTCGFTCSSRRLFEVTKDATFGGKECTITHGNVEYRSCSPGDGNCPPLDINCVGTWSQWSPCSVHCMMNRTYSVITAKSGNGNDCTTLINGVPIVRDHGDVQTHDCFFGQCPKTAPLTEAPTMVPTIPGTDPPDPTQRPTTDPCPNPPCDTTTTKAATTPPMQTEVATNGPQDTQPTADTAMPTQGPAVVNGVGRGSPLVTGWVVVAAACVLTLA